MKEDRMRKMSSSYDTVNGDNKKLNKKIIKLEKKFKYACLKASFILPQDKEDKMRKELGIWKRQTGEA